MKRTTTTKEYFDEVGLLVERITIVEEDDQTSPLLADFIETRKAKGPMERAIEGAYATAIADSAQPMPTIGLEPDDAPPFWEDGVFHSTDGKVYPQAKTYPSYLHPAGRGRAVEFFDQDGPTADILPFPIKDPT